jgi:hypothetical protein
MRNVNNGMMMTKMVILHPLLLRVFLPYSLLLIWSRIAG